VALKLWVVENRPSPLLWPLAYTTACKAVTMFVWTSLHTWFFQPHNVTSSGFWGPTGALPVDPAEGLPPVPLPNQNPGSAPANSNDLTQYTEIHCMNYAARESDTVGSEALSTYPLPKLGWADEKTLIPHHPHARTSEGFKLKHCRKCQQNL